jgi:hypothetical protein
MHLIRPGRFHRLLPAAILLAVSLYRYYPALAGYWRWDDTALLQQALKHPFWQNFVVPEVYRQLSGANLTPWVLLSFKADLSLFGNNPIYYYLHHLLSLALAAVVFYNVLILWVGPKTALVGALLFLLGAPTATVAEQLMTRHYIEGLILALVAVLCYVRYVRGGPRRAFVSAMFCYLFAVTAKEVYVPLVFLPLCISEGTLGRRLQGLMAFGLVAVAYIFWRFWMLGVFIGGYTGGDVAWMASMLPLVGTGLARLPAVAGGHTWIIPLAAWLLLGVTYAFCFPVRVVRGILILVLVLLPLVPLTVSPGITLPNRYLLVLWLVLVMMGCVAADRLFQAAAKVSIKRIAVTGLRVLIVVVAVLLIDYGYETSGAVRRTAREFDVQGRFLWHHEDPSICYVPTMNIAVHYWYVDCLGWIREKTGCGTRAMPRAIVDDWFLDEGVERLFEYSPESGCMRDVSATIDERREAARVRVKTAPLAVEFTGRSAHLSWTLGPYTNGWYYAIINGHGMWPLPSAGSMRVHIHDTFRFCVRYTSPAGWATFSPFFTLRPENTTIRWKR